ncbi:hypothetical protein C8J57DRAFT_1719247 [Mycena rebaudengoi]|nr:hypothetical protein C8J57DRAFT_1719247 [Mycena rebaudengoi]
MADERISSVKRVDTDLSVSSVGYEAAKRTSRFRPSVADAHARTFQDVSKHAPPTPKEVNNFRTYLIGFTICFGAIAYGYDTGFFGGSLALPSFQQDFGLVTQSKSARDNASANLVSLFQGGSFFGAGLQLPVTQKLGRKWAIIISNIIFIASAFIQVFANGSVPLMMFGRFVGGFAIGISSLAIPVYLAEFAPPSIRGRLVGFFDICIQIGTLAGFWINYGMAKNVKSSKFQWQFPFAVQLFPAAILFVGMFFIPETPRWLITKGRSEEAEKNLSYIRKLPIEHEYLRYELEQTRQQVDAENLVRGDDGPLDLVKQLFRAKGHRNRLLLGMALIFFKTFSGVQAVNYYSPRIFEQLGFKGAQNSLFATGIYGTVKTVCTLIFGLFIVDRVGRRIPLMFSSLSGSLCLFFIGGYLTAVGPRDGSNAARTPGDYAAITAIFLYASAYCFGYNSVPLTLISEIFTLRYKTLSMTFCMMWQWLCTFAIVRIMPIALTNIGASTYFVFGSIFFTATIFVYFVIPETKGLPLEAMDQLFGGVQRSDVEAAVMEAELAGDKPHTKVQHIENATDVARPAFLPPIGESDEKNAGGPS